MFLKRPRVLAVMAVILTPAVLIGISWMGELHRSQEIGPLIEEASARTGISSSLLRALVWRESDFEPRATGSAGERGLMQVTPGAGHDWAQANRIRTFHETDLFDPRTNLSAGSWYLASAMKRWSNADRPEVFALAEYNAGITHARRWARDNPALRAEDFLLAMDFPTTKAYILSILQRAELYAAGRDPGPFEAIQRKMALKKEKWLKK